jgi:hypothetical protein
MTYRDAVKNRTLCTLTISSKSHCRRQLAARRFSALDAVRYLILLRFMLGSCFFAAQIALQVESPAPTSRRDPMQLANRPQKRHVP